MTRFDDDQLVAWLNEGPQHGAAGAADDALRLAYAGTQRPGWLVAVTEGTLAGDRSSTVLRFVALTAAMALLTGLLLGALVAGGIIKPFPAPSIFAIESGSAAPSPATSPVPSEAARRGLVAYSVNSTLEPGEGSCTESFAMGCEVTSIEIANADGSNPRELLKPARGGQRPIGWTANGSRLLVDDSDGLSLVNLSGEIERLRWTSLCAYPCNGLDGFSLSPDGSRLAFVRAYSDTDNGTVIAIMDMSSRKITELSSTYAKNPPVGVQCHDTQACEGSDGSPHWSPDGSRLAFERQHISPDTKGQWTSAAVFVVDADGTNLRRITPRGLFAHDPSWSPDGTLITFVNSPVTVSADGESAVFEPIDVYVVRPDGTGFRQLTDDGVSGRPDWTPDGRIVFARRIETPSTVLWVMAADGSGATRVGTTLSELSSAGCVSCMFPVDIQRFGPMDAVWQVAP